MNEYNIYHTEGGNIGCGGDVYSTKERIINNITQYKSNGLHALFGVIAGCLFSFLINKGEYDIKSFALYGLVIGGISFILSFCLRHINNLHLVKGYLTILFISTVIGCIGIYFYNKSESKTEDIEIPDYNKLMQEAQQFQPGPSNSLNPIPSENITENVEKVN